MKFSFQVLLTFFSRLLIRVLSFIISVLIARFLGPVGKGLISYVNTIVALLNQFGTFGFSASTIYFLAKEKERRHIVASTIIAFSSGVVLLFDGALFAAWWFLNIFHDLNTLLILIVLLRFPFMLFAQRMSDFYLAYQKIKLYNAVSSASAVLSVIVTAVIILLFHGGAVHVLLGHLAVSFVQFAFNIGFWLYNRVVRFVVDKMLLSEMVKYGLKFYVNNLCAFMVLRSDILFIKHYHDNWHVGQYSVAVQAAELIYMVVSTASLLLFPKLADKSPQEAAYYVRRTLRITLHLMLILLTVWAFTGRIFIIAVFSSRFAPAVSPFYILLPGMFFLALWSVSTRYFAVTGMPLFVPMAWVIFSAVNIILNIFLIPSLGVAGAAAASSLTYMCVAGFLLYKFFTITGTPVKKVFYTSWEELKEDAKLLLPV